MIENLEIIIQESDKLYNILGEQDRNLKSLINFYGINIIVNKGVISVDTENKELIDEISALFYVLNILSDKHISLRERDVIYIASLVKTHKTEDIIDFYSDRMEILKNFNGKSLYPKTISQAEYIKALDKNDIIFGFGPAGVGKTYLAVCDAVRRFKKGEYKRIILSRPIVEAGESLGYLPGEIKEKVDPYLIPLYDALYELLGKRTTDEYIEEGIIEIAPLAYMRGRTLENAYVILDEAQNTTVKQMKLFLTRLGFNAKMVITGDTSQVDLKDKNDSGLIYAINHLKGINRINLFLFNEKDVVRNPLVMSIIERFKND